MKHHPADEVLLAYVEGTIEPQVRTEVSAHVEAACADCAAKARAYREILAGLRAPALEAVPDTWVHAALGRIRDLHARPDQAAEPSLAERAIDRVRSALHEIHLGIVLDTGLGRALPGIRGAVGLEPRQLLFESDEASLHLRIQPGPGGKVDLMGQFVPAESAWSESAHAVLEQPQGRSARVELEPTGEFRFSVVPPGARAVRLRIEWGESSFATPEIELRSEA